MRVRAEVFVDTIAVYSAGLLSVNARKPEWGPGLVIVGHSGVGVAELTKSLPILCYLSGQN